MRRGSRSAIGLATALVVVSVAGGCRVSGAPTPMAAPRAQAPQWRAGVLRAALPAVLVVRGRTLGVQKLDSTQTVPLGEAPADTTPTILAVDQPSGRIAVLLRAAPTVTFKPGVPSLYPPDFSDAGIVVLSPDGSASRLAVQARVTPIHWVVNSASFTSGGSVVWVRPSGLTTPSPEMPPLRGTNGHRHRSIDATIPDVVTSGAFSDLGLVLTTQSCIDGWSGRRAGTPLLLALDGRTSPLADEGSATAGPVQQFCQLGDGQVLGVRATSQGFLSQHSASLVEPRGSTLVTTSPAYAAGSQGLGSVAAAVGPVDFVYSYQTNELFEFVVASVITDVWQTTPIRVDRALGFDRQKNYGPTMIVVGQPQAGPMASVLAPAVLHGTRAHPSFDATVAPLVQFNADGTMAEPKRMIVALADNDSQGTTYTWTYLAHFGR